MAGGSGYTETRRKWMMDRAGMGALVLILMAGPGACSPSSASEGEESGDELAVAERGDLEIRVEASGQVEPILVVEVKSKASGEVTALHVETGDRVERGELLAEVDPRDVRSVLAQAEADLEVAKARLQIAESQASRSRDLREANVVTQQELEQAVLDAANARAQLIKAQNSQQLAREKMGDVTIRAPIGGTIIQKNVEAGQIIASASGNVSGGTTLLLMADLSTMQVRTLVDETDIGKVQPGQVARVQVEAYPDRSFVGTVYKIEPQAVVDQNVTMFPVLVRLDNRGGLLKPNMNAEVQVEVAERRDVVLVPNAAVVGLREATVAGEVLGLSADAVRASLQEGRGGGATRRARGDSAREEGVTPDTAAGTRSTAGSNGAGAGAVDCQALVSKTRTDRSSLTDEERGQVRSCFAEMGGGRGMQGARRGSGSGDTRPAVLFVATPQGPEARLVQLGVNDWDRTQVVSGLEAGEKVILVSVAQLRQQQQEMQDRIRQRSNPLGGGGRGR